MFRSGLKLFVVADSLFLTLVNIFLKVITNNKAHFLNETYLEITCRWYLHFHILNIDTVCNIWNYVLSYCDNYDIIPLLALTKKESLEIV